MSTLIQTFQDFWNWLSSVVPEPVLKCLTALSLLCLFYFLFLRWIFSLFGNKTVTKMIDFLFIVVCVCTIIVIITPSININHHIDVVETTATTETFATSVEEFIEPAIIGG